MDFGRRRREGQARGQRDGGQVQKLGPLGIPQKFTEWDKEMEHLAAQVAEKEAASACACTEHGQPATQANKMEAAHV